MLSGSGPWTLQRSSCRPRVSATATFSTSHTCCAAESEGMHGRHASASLPVLQHRNMHPLIYGIDPTVYGCDADSCKVICRDALCLCQVR